MDISPFSSRNVSPTRSDRSLVSARFSTNHYAVWRLIGYSTEDWGNARLVSGATLRKLEHHGIWRDEMRLVHYPMPTKCRIRPSPVMQPRARRPSTVPDAVRLELAF